MTQVHILPPKSFYLLRHGESDANLRRVAAGGMLDTPLTPLGIQQAKALGAVAHLLPVRPSKIYHSPLSRAKDTAQHVNENLELEMVEIDALREHIFGDWEEVSWETIRPLVQQGHNPPNGETYDQFAERVRLVIHHIFQEDHSASPLLVAHGGLFRSIGRLYGVPIEHVPNCSLFHFVPAPEKVEFPWAITSFTPCPEQGLKAEAFYSSSL